MAASLTLIGISAAVFVSTNIDDIFLLAAFFADPPPRARAIVAGQFLGIGVLVLGSVLATSSAGLLAASSLPGVGAGVLTRCVNSARHVLRLCRSAACPEQGITPGVLEFPGRLWGIGGPVPSP